MIAINPLPVFTARGIVATNELGADMRENFGTFTDGRNIERVTLQNDDMIVQILNLGGVIQSVRWQGTDQNLMLGYPTAEPYLTNPGKLGALVGRYANRIRNAKAVIDGVEYHFDANLGGQHTLHGGSDTIAKRLMQIVDLTATSVTLRDIMPDGHMGFPGNLDIHVTYELVGSTLRTDIRATTDKTTLCNITGHGYFNLSGSHIIDDHSMQVMADTILELDDVSIPTGRKLPVAGTVYDLRDMTSLAWNGSARAIDINYCLSQDQTELRDVAILRAGHHSMTLATTEAGLQVYTAVTLGTPLPSSPTGTAYHPYAGVALEPQFYPDSPNHPDFAQAILHPGDAYHHVTEYKFAKT